MRDLQYGYIKRDLQFNFEAKTSRGPIESHSSYLIHVTHPSKPDIQGWGESAPLKGLSLDGGEDFEDKLKEIIRQLNEGILSYQIDWQLIPAIRFGIETAQLDLWNGGRKILFDNPFIQGTPIPINGLIWMSDPEHMLQQAINKAQEGYTCLKFKVGAQQHEAECRMLEKFRKHFSDAKIQIRLDANGAFPLEEALPRLKEFSRFGIHSMEQPIRAGLYEESEELCAKSPIDIALDEELIGIDPEGEGAARIKKTGASYLIFKPTLLGGFSVCSKWARRAEENQMQWWATSALESNIGLNAIAQWTSIQKNKLPQGLGTGALYTNNIDSPLLAEKGALHYIAGKEWSLPK